MISILGTVIHVSADVEGIVCQRTFYPVPSFRKALKKYLVEGDLGSRHHLSGETSI